MAKSEIKKNCNLRKKSSLITWGGFRLNNFRVNTHKVWWMWDLPKKLWCSEHSAHMTDQLFPVCIIITTFLLRLQTPCNMADASWHERTVTPCSMESNSWRPLCMLSCGLFATPPRILYHVILWRHYPLRSRVHLLKTFKSLFKMCSKCYIYMVKDVLISTPKTKRRLSFVRIRTLTFPSDFLDLFKRRKIPFGRLSTLSTIFWIIIVSLQGDTAGENIYLRVLFNFENLGCNMLSIRLVEIKCLKCTFKCLFQFRFMFCSRWCFVHVMFDFFFYSCIFCIIKHAKVNCFNESEAIMVSITWFFFFILIFLVNYFPKKRKHE